MAYTVNCLLLELSLWCTGAVSCITYRRIIGKATEALLVHTTIAVGEVTKPRVVMVQDSRGLFWNVASHGIGQQTP